MTEVIGAIAPDAAARIAVTTTVGIVARGPGLFVRQELYDAEDQFITGWSMGPLATEPEARAYMGKLAERFEAEGKMRVRCIDAIMRVA